jgi:hypothetical protein
LWIQEDETGEDEEFVDFGKIASVHGFLRTISDVPVGFSVFVLEDNSAIDVKWSNGQFFSSDAHSKFSKHGSPKNFMANLGKNFCLCFSSSENLSLMKSHSKVASFECVFIRDKPRSKNWRCLRQWFSPCFFVEKFAKELNIKFINVNEKSGTYYCRHSRVDSEDDNVPLGNLTQKVPPTKTPGI